MALFQKGDRVEVCSKQEGFRGSYFEAKVILRFDDDKLYEVEYKNLVEEDDHSQPLTEIIPADEVRPLPPKTPQPTKLLRNQTVDVFDNDGWWVGKISGKKGSKYLVYFETTNQLIAYPVSQMRIHLEWIQGKWVYA